MSQDTSNTQESDTLELGGYRGRLFEAGPQIMIERAKLWLEESQKDLPEETAKRISEIREAHAESAAAIASAIAKLDSTKPDYLAKVTQLATQNATAESELESEIQGLTMQHSLDAFGSFLESYGLSLGSKSQTLQTNRVYEIAWKHVKRTYLVHEDKVEIYAQNGTTSDLELVLSPSTFPNTYPTSLTGLQGLHYQVYRGDNTKQFADKQLRLKAIEESNDSWHTVVGVPTKHTNGINDVTNKSPLKDRNMVEYTPETWLKAFPRKAQGSE